MLGWQHPSALWALTLVAVPIAIHLLRTRHARRVLFPTLRFVRPSRAAAVRMHLPSDALLMLVRIGLVAFAAAALAGPIVVTGARLAGWNARVARAVVVDTSESMRVGDGAAARPQIAAVEASDAEQRTAVFSARFDVSRIEDGVVRASRWLAAQPPSRRELVIVSDLQASAFTALRPEASVPEGTGLRFVSVGRPELRREIDGKALFAGPGRGRAQRITVTRESTSVAIDAPAEVGGRGLRILGPPQSDARIARLLRAVSTAGAYAGAADQPMLIRLAGAPSELPDPPGVVQAGWMLSTALRLRGSESLAVAAAAMRLAKPPFDPAAGPWSTIVRDSNGAALVRAAASNGELVIDVAAGPDDIFAAVAVQAVLDARVDDASYDEQEIARLDDSVIAAMTRSPGPVTREAWRAAETTDGRWCWVAALILLGVEQWLRSRRSRAQSEEGTRAAA